MQQIFASEASLFQLISRTWEERGRAGAGGNLTLYSFPVRQDELLLKFNNVREWTYTLCAGKIKSQDHNAWVLKSLDNSTNETVIIAVRFTDDEKAGLFADIFLRLSETRENTINHRTSGWRCPSCTFENPPNRPQCDMCGRSNQLAGSPSSFEDLSFSPVIRPRRGDVGVPPRAFSNGSDFRLCVPPPPPRDDRRETSQWTCLGCTLVNETGDSLCAACGAQRFLPAKAKPPHPHRMLSNQSLWDMDSDGIEMPSEDIQLRHRVQEVFDVHRAEGPITKTDFQIAASHIACAPNYSRIVFVTLKSVARRLLLDDPQYRVLDATNRRVQERLLGYDGVLDFLELLGFYGDVFGTRLECLEPPPHSCVEDAIDVLDNYVENRPVFLGGGGGGDVGGGNLDHDARDDDGKDMEGMSAFERDHALNSGLTRGRPGDFGSGRRGSDAEEDRKQHTDQFTVEQIVLWVTHQSQLGRQTGDVLILCYSMISPPQTLIQALRDRYFSIPIPPDLTPMERELFVKSEQRPVQIKVGSLLQSWIRSFWKEDFADDEKSQAHVESFLDEMREEGGNFNESLSTKISTMFERMKNEAPIDQSLWHLHRDDDMPPLDDVRLTKMINSKSSDEIANQITLMDSAIFSSIRERECLGQGWKKKDREERSPNVLAMIAQFNDFSKWVQVLVLQEKTLKKRSLALKRIIKMGERFCALQNYNSLCAVFSALGATVIHRLQHAWDKVPKKEKQSFEDFRLLFARDKNHKNLRFLLRQAAGPTVPHIGLFLQDLVSIDEGNKTRKEIALHEDQNTEIFNFEKAIRSTERIKTMALYQQRQYELRPDVRVQRALLDVLVKAKDLTEDDMWALSTAAKKSDAKDSRSWLG